MENQQLKKEDRKLGKRKTGRKVEKMTGKR